MNQFNKYASLLDDTFDRLVGMPTLGIRHDNPRLEFHQYRVGQHYIFYRIGIENIEIARILHTRRKISPDLFDDLIF